MSKRNKASKSENTVAQTDATPVQEVSTIEATLQQEAAAVVQATPENTVQATAMTVKAVSAAKARYTDLANTHPLTRVKDTDGTAYAPKNKGAFMAALWYAVCAVVGYTNTKAHNASINTVCAKLGAHAVTHCASKGKALAGAEVSDNGAVGYARALKGALQGATDQHSTRFAQYLVGGKYHDKCTAESKLATLLVAQHGATEGIDACKRAVGVVSV